MLLLSNLAVLALPVAGLWGLRLYESALLRQTESELVAQAAVLAGIFREEMHLPPEAPPPGTPPQPASAALHMARRPGLDFASDPVLPPAPDPAPGPSGDPAAIAAGSVLTSVLRDTQLVTLASLRVTDRHGVIVATTGSDLGRSLAGWDEVRRVLDGEPVVSLMRRREQAQAVAGGIGRAATLRVFVALPVMDRAGTAVGAVVLSRTPSTLGQAVWGKRRELTSLLVLLLAGGVALAAGISRLVTRPLARVVTQAQVVAAGGRLEALPRCGTREVAELSDAIARMASTLEQRAGYIAAFAASVSHEFKTPLAAIRAAGELLEEHGDTTSPDERQHLLDLVSGGVARLELLVRRLVDLARADMVRVMPGGTGNGVAVGPVLDRVVARFRARGLGVDVHTATVATVALPADALDALLTGLLDNVVTHAPGGVARVTAGIVGNEMHLIVQDDGPGIPPAHRDRAFEPFFTTAREHGGTGLGLPIVRALAMSSGGHVTLLPSDVGTVFLVTLPLAVIGGALSPT